MTLHVDLHQLWMDIQCPSHVDTMTLLLAVPTSGSWGSREWLLGAEGWLDWLFGESRCGPAKFSLLIYPERSRRVVTVNSARLIAREGVL